MINMINENILSLAKSFTGTQSYSILISDIEQKTECNQDSLIFTLYQIDEEIEEIIKEKHVTERKFHVVSNLSTDDNGLFATHLSGYLTTEKGNILTEYVPIEKIEEKQENALSHRIEVLETRIKKEIEISFTMSYKNQPKIIINKEKQYQNLYKEPVFDYIMDNELYTGVKITFNNLKTRKEYPTISIIIIGDLIEEEPEENENDTTE